jgi:hypothetical protein
MSPIVDNTPPIVAHASVRCPARLLTLAGVLSVFLAAGRVHAQAASAGAEVIHRLALQNRASVLKAAQEFDSLGRESLLEKHGYGKAREHFLFLNGKHYDSKADCGVAYGHEHHGLAKIRLQSRRRHRSRQIASSQKLGIRHLHGQWRPLFISSYRLTAGAALLPARHASTIDPIQTLRQE